MGQEDERLIRACHLSLQLLPKVLVIEIEASATSFVMSQQLEPTTLPLAPFPTVLSAVCVRQNQKKMAVWPF